MMYGLCRSLLATSISTARNSVHWVPKRNITTGRSLFEYLHGSDVNWNRADQQKFFRLAAIIRSDKESTKDGVIDLQALEKTRNSRRERDWACEMDNFKDVTNYSALRSACQIYCDDQIHDGASNFDEIVKKWMSSPETRLEYEEKARQERKELTPEYKKWLDKTKTLRRQLINQKTMEEMDDRLHFAWFKLNYSVLPEKAFVDAQVGEEEFKKDFEEKEALEDSQFDELFERGSWEKRTRVIKGKKEEDPTDK